MHLFRGADLQSRLDGSGQLGAQRLRHLGHLGGVSGSILALYGGKHQRRKRLVIQRLACVLCKQLRQLAVDLLPEREHRVAFGLLGAELSTRLKDLRLRLRTLAQLVRFTSGVGKDRLRLLLRVGKDARSFLISAFNSVFPDGRNKILYLKFHIDHLPVGFSFI